MLSAAVPPASVDEHGDPRPWEDHVRCVPHAGQRARVNPVTEASGVDQAPDGHLRASIAAAVGLHRPARRRRAGMASAGTARTGRDPAAARAGDAPGSGPRPSGRPRGGQ
jgi:hypothetical protein